MQIKNSLGLMMPRKSPIAIPVITTKLRRKRDCQTARQMNANGLAASTVRACRLPAAFNQRADVHAVRLADHDVFAAGRQGIALADIHPFVARSTCHDEATDHTGALCPSSVRK